MWKNEYFIYFASDITHHLFSLLRTILCLNNLLTGTISDINNLILDYLTMEGYPLAAAKFSKEANLSPRQEDPAIKARQQIRNSIHQGNIQEAIEALNELDPQVCNLLSRFFGQSPSTMIRT